MIISATKFKNHVSRGKWHYKSKRLDTVISKLTRYHGAKNDVNLRALQASVVDWAKQDPKEFLATNLNSKNAVYDFYAEVNCQFYLKKLGPFQGKAQPKGLVFIPFTGQNSKEFKVKSEQWNEAEKVNLSGGIDAKKYRQFDIVIWEDKIISNEVKDLSTTNSEIFIRAHGSIGATHVSTRNTPIEDKASVTTAISVTEVCDRLISSGLKTSYAGNIHFYSCYSGVDILPQKMKETHAKQKIKIDNGQTVKKEHLVGPDCIARIGAKYLKSKGYVNAKFFGYLGPLKSEYSKPVFEKDNIRTPVIKEEIDDFMHRYVQICPQGYNILGSSGVYMGSGDVAKTYRARAGRREF